MNNTANKKRLTYAAPKLVSLPQASQAVGQGCNNGSSEAAICQNGGSAMSQCTGGTAFSVCPMPFSFACLDGSFATGGCFSGTGG